MIWTEKEWVTLLHKYATGFIKVLKKDFRICTQNPTLLGGALHKFWEYANMLPSFTNRTILLRINLCLNYLCLLTEFTLSRAEPDSSSVSIIAMLVVWVFYHWVIFPVPISLFGEGSHVAWVIPRFVRHLRMALDSWSFCLYFPNVRIKWMNLYTQFVSMIWISGQF